MFENWFKTGILLAAIMALFGVVGGLIGGQQGMLIALLIGGAMNIFAYWFSDQMVLKLYRAREVDETSAPQFYNMVKELAQRAGLPMPRVYIIDEAQPNAFATGRNPQNAAVAATTGILQLLSARELRGVMAHELAHVKNRDVMIMTLASFFASMASMISQFAFFWGSDDDDSPAGAVVFLVSFLVYIISFFLMLALSRYREFTADRGAALITGRPSALASALMKISGEVQRVPTRDLRTAGEMNAFFIVPLGVKSAVQTLFSTPPPIEKRIERLSRLEAELQARA